MACCDAGSEITLVWGVSKRIFPSLDRHIRDADCVGAAPPAGCVFVLQSEHEGGVAGGLCGIWTTAGLSLARREILGTAREVITPMLSPQCY